MMLRSRRDVLFVVAGFGLLLLATVPVWAGWRAMSTANGTLLSSDWVDAVGVGSDAPTVFPAVRARLKVSCPAGKAALDLTEHPDALPGFAGPPLGPVWLAVDDRWGRVPGRFGDLQFYERAVLGDLLITMMERDKVVLRVEVIPGLSDKPSWLLELSFDTSTARTALDAAYPNAYNSH